MNRSWIAPALYFAGLQGLRDELAGRLDAVQRHKAPGRAYARAATLGTAKPGESR